jgi:2-iminobutanoate/2-iminopropanoate deaminase
MARSIHVPGLGHGSNPIPAAARRGPLLVTGGISGVDRTTGTRPAGVDEQIGNMFANLAAVLAAGGASVDDVVQVAVVLADGASRPLLNDEWVKTFPDEAARPARHVVVRPLPGGMAVQLEAQAYVTGDADG